MHEDLVSPDQIGHDEIHININIRSILHRHCRRCLLPGGSRYCSKIDWESSQPSRPQFVIVRLTLSENKVPPSIARRGDSRRHFYFHCEPTITGRCFGRAILLRIIVNVRWRYQRNSSQYRSKGTRPKTTEVPSPRRRRRPLSSSSTSVVARGHDLERSQGPGGQRSASAPTIPRRLVMRACSTVDTVIVSPVLNLSLFLFLSAT